MLPMIIAIFGGNHSNGGNYGTFYWNLNNVPSNSNTNICSRLYIINLGHVVNYMSSLLLSH